MSVLDFIVSIFVVIAIVIMFIGWLTIKYDVAERDIKLKKYELELKKYEEKEKRRVKNQKKKYQKIKKEEGKKVCLETGTKLNNLKK